MNEVTRNERAEELAEIGFAPAHVEVEGKNANERRLALVKKGMSLAAKLYLLGKAKGKTLTALQDSTGKDGDMLVAQAVLTGTYGPLAEALAFMLGENITIATRKDYESMGWSFRHRLANLKDGGWSKSKDKDGNQKPTAERVALLACLELLDSVSEKIKELVESRRKQPEAQQKTIDQG